MLEAERFLLVLAGRAAPACTEIACLNAAAVLLVAGRVPDLAGRGSKSRDLLQSGDAFETLCRWVQAQADGDAGAVQCFRECARRVGLADQGHRLTSFQFLVNDETSNGTTHRHERRDDMAKSQDVKKDAKKKAQKTLKEKRAEKKSKKDKA